MLEKNKGGRPTKYREEYCDRIIEYFNQEPFSVVMVDNEEGIKVPATNKSGGVIMMPCKLPTFEGFAISIGVHRATLIDWCKEHKEFLDAYTQAKDFQKEILIQNGLMGNYEKQFAIFTAKNVTDMKDKQDIDVVTNGESINKPSVIQLVAPDESKD